MNRFPEQSAAQQEGAFSGYLAAIRAHPLLVALVTLATVGASIAFLATRSARYEATANLLVNPIPQEDEVFLGLPLIRDSGDPVRTVQTAASLVESQPAAELAAEFMGEGWTAKEVLDSIEVAPRGESNVLGVTATAGGAAESARLANSFSRAALEVRGDEIVDEARAQVRQLGAELDTLPPGDAARVELASRRSQLEGLITRGDPTLAPSEEAIAPNAAIGAPAPVIVALALLAGFILGSGTALLAELLARRVRDPEDALKLYPLPVLARVPELAARHRQGPAEATWFMPPRIREPFRTLALQLQERHGLQGAVMITSPTSGDGKTTSAINLAVSLAAGGKEVVLLDLDLRNPRVGEALGIEGRDTISDLIDPDVEIERLLFRASDLSSLRVLPLVGAPDQMRLIDVVGTRLPRLVAEARAVADYVVIDTAPLGEVGDALKLAREVEDVVVVMRPGNTDRNHLSILRDLLEGVGITPAGYLVIGREDGSTRGYYSYGAAQAQTNMTFEGRAETSAPSPRPAEAEAEAEDDPAPDAKDTAEKGRVRRGPGRMPA